MTVKNIIVFLGAPGSGKGTQSQKLSEHFNYPALSTGSILRAEISSNSSLGMKVQEIINAGMLVSDDIMNELVLKMLENSNEAGVILDGYPRTQPQAIFFDEFVKSKNINLSIVNLYVDPDNLVNRFTGRFSCKGCGAIYHDVYSKTKLDGICDKCGGAEFVRRADDSYDAVKTRLKVYDENTKPLLEYYQNYQNFIEVNGEMAIDDITRNLISFLTK